MDNLGAELSQLEAKGLLRELSLQNGVDFASNDYLGFAHHPAIHLGLLNFLKQTTQIGATGSRLISGNSEHIEKTEAFLAQTFYAPASLIFGSGYLANLGVCASLGGEDTEFFSDCLNHASLIDGMRLAKSSIQIFNHNDCNDLRAKLLKSSAKRKVIVTESVFSMDGDLAPLESLVELAREFDAYLIVDEAHGTGACGVDGRGAMHGLAYDQERTVIVHTCGKALGAYGAFVCCSKFFRRLMINKARTQIYTTALSPLSVEHIRLAVERLVDEPSAVANLQKRVAHAHLKFSESGVETVRSHIIPIVLGSNEAVIAGAKRLQQEGFFVKAIRSPTVAAGSERLRVTLKADHSFSDLDRVIQILSELKDEHLCRGH